MAEGLFLIKSFSPDFLPPLHVFCPAGQIAGQNIVDISMNTIIAFLVIR
jgi:hypothetical protein